MPNKNNKKMVEINKLYFLLEIVIFLPMYLKSNQEKILFEDALFPNTLTLLNQNFFLVDNNGIHYFTPEFVEDDTKSILFENKLADESESIKVSMVQFPEKDNGYVMILAQEVIYFFESDGTLINNIDLKEIINAEKYCLIPYKKENNDLYYLVIYNLKEIFIIKVFTFNIITHVNDAIISNNYTIFSQFYEYGNVISSKIFGINCFFTPTSFKDYDILTCFYSSFYPTEIHVKSFDSKNNFTELTELFHYYFKNIDFPMISDISIAINTQKQQFLLICVCQKSFWMTFDFNDLFSEPQLLFDDDDSSSSLIIMGYKAKMYYFRQTHEYLFISSSIMCTKYIMLFNQNFTLKTLIFL